MQTRFLLPLLLGTLVSRTVEAQLEEERKRFAQEAPLLSEFLQEEVRRCTGI